MEVRVDELPKNPADILDIFKAEIAPLAVWIDFAVSLFHISLMLLNNKKLEYYKQGNIEAFLQLLTEGTDPGNSNSC